MTLENCLRLISLPCGVVGIRMGFLLSGITTELKFLPGKGKFQICLQLPKEFSDAGELSEAHLLALRGRGGEDGVPVVLVTVSRGRLLEVV